MERGKRERIGLSFSPLSLDHFSAFLGVQMISGLLPDPKFSSSEAVQELTEVETLVPHKAILLYKICIYSLIMLLWDRRTVIYSNIRWD